MSTRRTALAVLVATGALAAFVPVASAADNLGAHVAMCAHELGQRADAPAVTCSHDGMTMTFPTFGAMVEHMRAMH